MKRIKPTPNPSLKGRASKIWRMIVMCVITAWAMLISGQETETYNLPFDNVMECCMMPDMQHALITTRTPLLKPEYAIVRDLKQGKNLWKINMQRDIDILASHEGVIVYGLLDGKKLTFNLYELTSGKKRYELSIFPTYISDEDDVVMGYKITGSNDILFGTKIRRSKQLECYRLSTGELMWKADAAPNKYEIWNDHKRIAPHRVVAIAEDLILIDTEKGVLNHQPLKTVINYVSLGSNISAVSSGGTSIGLSFATSRGIFSFRIGQRNAMGPGSITIPLGSQLEAINSNVLTSNDAIYVTDRKGLYCYDTELNEKWTHEFPAKTVCHADIRMVNDTLVMLNEGYGVYGDGSSLYKNTLVTAGKMFYATYNPQTGEESSFDPIKGDWNTDQFGEHLTLETENIFVPNADETTMVPVSRPAKSLAIYDRNDQLLVIDNNDETIATIPADEVYHIIVSDERHLIYTNQKKGNHIYVTDLERNVLQHIEANYINLMLQDNQLVVSTTQEIRIIKL